MKKLISVIIPTHNRAELLPRAIDSVLKQTISDWELIVVSDGSTDKTDEIMKSYSDERINYVSYYPPKGGNEARNTGIEAAKYEYVAFLDDDDEWSDDKLEKQLSTFERDSDVGLVYTGINTIYVEENVSYTSTPKKVGDLSKDIFFMNYIGTTSSVMTKKSLVQEVGAFDVKLGAQQDYDLWIRICQITKIAAVMEPCVKYYNYPGTNQISQQIDKYLESSKLIKEKYQVAYAKLTDKELKKIESRNLLFLATKAMRSDDHKLTRTYALKSFEKTASLSAMLYFIVSPLNYSSVLKIRKLLKR